MSHRHRAYFECPCCTERNEVFLERGHLCNVLTLGIWLCRKDHSLFLWVCNVRLEPAFTKEAMAIITVNAANEIVHGVGVMRIRLTWSLD